MQYHLLDVFTDRVFGGNQLAVFPDTPASTETAVMQRIAGELALSETVFVFPAQRAGTDYRLRIFTPRMELPFAGHPTVGTAVLLAELRGAGASASWHLEENAGIVTVNVLQRGATRYAELRVPETPRLGPATPARAELAALIGVSPGDLAPPPDEPCAAAAGVPFVIIPVAGRDVLGRVRLDATRWQSLLAGWWAPHVYVLCHDGERRVLARMFAPAMGIAEDPATGAAAAALPAYLARRHAPGAGTYQWTIQQGTEMGRPSRLDLRFVVSARGLDEVYVGGEAVRVGEGRLFV